MLGWEVKKKEGKNQTSKYEDMTEFKKDIDKKLENVIDKLSNNQSVNRGI